MKRILQKNQKEIYSSKSELFYQKELEEFECVDYLTELKLSQRIQKGDKEAKEQLIEANLRLVYKIAEKNAHGDSQLMMDLVQEGNIGLTIATEKFDSSKGIRFSAYAVFWIQKYIYAFLNQNQQIIIPEKTYNLLKNIRETREQLCQTLLREPTDKELAKEMNISENQLRKILGYEFGYISIEQINGQEISVQEGDMFEKQIISDLIECLEDEKDKQIIIWYLGLNGCSPLNYQQIGKLLNMSKQAVGQRYNKAIRKIKENYDKQED